jgi:predicted MFS family arabinose efflux permease
MRKRDPLDALAFTIGAFLFWVNGDNYAAAPLLVRMASDFGVGIAQAAATVTSYMLCFGLFTVVLGPLGDRFGKLRILKVAAAGSAIASAASTFCPSLTAVIIARAVNGAFSAGIMPVAMALIGERSSAETRHARIGRTMGIMFLGGALATAIGGAISQYGSWRQVYFAYGIAELALLIPLFMLLKEEKSVGAGAGARGPDARANPEISVTAGSVRSGRILALAGVLLLVGFATLGSFSYLGKIIQDRTGSGLMTIGLILSGYGLGTIAGGRFAGALKDRLGRAYFLLAGLLGGGGFLAFGVFADKPWATVPALFIAGFCFVCAQSAIVTAMQDLMAPKRGLAMSIASFCMVTSGAVGTYVNGRLYSPGGGPITYLAAIGFAAAGAIASLASATRANRS